MFKENKINLFIMVKFTRRKMKNPLHVDNKKNTLLLKHLNEKINVMQLENKMKILDEDIKNEEEYMEYKGKYKRYNELWNNKEKLIQFYRQPIFLDNAHLEIESMFNDLKNRFRDLLN